MQPQQQRITKSNGAWREKASVSPTAEYMLVTPQLASEWLALRHEDQRNLSKTHVLRHVKLLEDGDFKFSSDCVTIDVDGKLINGQHRLAAVERTGIPAPMLVCFNAPANTIYTIDQGRRRLASQFLNERNAKHKTAAVGYLAHVEKCSPINGAGANSYYIMPIEKTIEFIETDKRGKTICRAVDAIRKDPKLSILCKPTSLFAALWAHFEQVGGRDYADMFFDELREGNSSPIKLLELFLMKENSKRNCGSKNEKLVKTIRAWNAWRSDRSIVRLISDGDVPEAI